jgi:repressor LexA
MTRPLVLGLTVTHKRILKAISSLAASGVPPTVADLVNELGLAGPTSVSRTLKIIERNGFIQIHGGGTQGRRQCVTLSPGARAVMGMGPIPVLGKIPAGRLADVFQDCETVIEPNELLPYRPGDFLLVVEGDSMIGDGILPGDKVLLRPNLHPHEGEIAAVHVGDEHYASLKHIHFSRSRGIVILRASNPTYDDVRVPASNVRIAGVYRGLVRSNP